MSRLALLIMLAVLVGCDSGIEQTNPGARVPIYRCTAQWLELHYPRQSHPQLYHGGNLVGLYVPTPAPAIYFVRGHDWILPHELAHLADDLNSSYWDALKAVSTPSHDLYQGKL